MIDPQMQREFQLALRSVESPLNQYTVFAQHDESVLDEIMCKAVAENAVLPNRMWVFVLIYPN